MHSKQWREGILIGVLLVLASWLVWLIWGLAGKAQVAVSEERNARRQYEALEIRKTTLQATIAAIETERGKDAAIRTAFGVARPGEEVIVVVPPTTTAPTTTPSWWEKIFSWF